MKLLQFNKTNMGGRIGDPNIRFNRKGAITISKAAAEGIGLDDQCAVAIFQDEEAPEDWYLAKVKDGGFALRGSESGSLIFNSAAMAKTVLDALGHDEQQCVIFPIRTKGQEPGKADSEDDANETDELENIEGGVIYLIITAKPTVVEQKN